MIVYKFDNCKYTIILWFTANHNYLVKKKFENVFRRHKNLFVFSLLIQNLAVFLYILIYNIYRITYIELYKYYIKVDTLIEKSFQKVRDVDTRFLRSVMDKIDWNDRLIV